MEKLNNKTYIDVCKAGGDALENAQKFKLFKDKIIPSFNNSNNNIVICSAVKFATRTLFDIFEARKSKNTLLIDQKFEEFYKMHKGIIEELFPPGHSIETWLHKSLLQMNRYVRSSIYRPDEESYGFILKFGELVSSEILSSYLSDNGLPSKLVDAREYIKTSRGYPATIKMGVSEKLIQNIKPLLKDHNLIISQGFIGRDYQTGNDSVMAYNSSDTSAAFFAHALRASTITYLKKVKGVWKFDDQFDVEDPEIERAMTYDSYGARFYGKDIYPVHPDAIMIASTRKIPVFIKSFETLGGGTLIH